jgi:hypothetical protein
VSDLWPWILLALLGAFHGLNPAMGWLFAVLMGFQARRLTAVVTALGPIALGHALSIGLVAVTIGLLGLAIPQSLLLTLGGLALLAFAAHKVATRFRHPRWVGLRVRRHELILWSFIMATAHGAGLMLVPVLVRVRNSPTPDNPAHAGHSSLAVTDTANPDTSAASVADHVGHLSTDSDALTPMLAATALHTAGMFVVMGAIAVLVYRWMGVEMLRRAWINLDLIWVGALVLAGGITLGLGLWPVVAP